MEAQIHTMLEMEPEELEAWYREHNFKSQYDALYEAAEAIDCAKTLAEAQSIKEQYSEYFLYNDNPGDDELFNPYLPNENPEYAYVCNIRGEVEIDGSVVNFNTLNSVEETHEYQLTHAAETRAKVEQHDNYLKGITNRHKYWAEGRLDKNEVVSIEFTAHKHNIFGWNKYKTAYYVQVQRYSRTWESFSPDFIYYINSSNKGLWTRELKSHTRLPVGRLAFHKTSTMDLYIYSRGTGKDGAGILKLKFTSVRAVK